MSNLLLFPPPYLHPKLCVLTEREPHFRQYWGRNEKYMSGFSMNLSATKELLFEQWSEDGSIGRIQIRNKPYN